MSPHFVILDRSHERINRLRFLLHLRGLKALLAMNVDEVLNWCAACRHSDAEMLGLILYDEADNRPHLQALEEVDFELPVYAIVQRSPVLSSNYDALTYVAGTVDDILKQLPSCPVRGAEACSSAQGQDQHTR